MADDTEDPNGSTAPPAGPRVVPTEAQLQTMMMVLLQGKPMGAVLNVTMATLGDMLVRIREIEVEQKDRGVDGPLEQREWADLKQAILTMIDQAKRILTDPDFAAAKNAYDLLGQDVPTRVM